MGKKLWTEEEERLLEELYKEGKSFKEISTIMNKTIGSISDKSVRMKLGEKYTRWNNPNFKAVYQDRDWCFERYINRGMSHQEMADECGATKRVIEKWCSQIYQLNSRTFRHLKKLNDMQKQIIMFGRLGDGHIDQRPTQPMYIESHAEDEKDYLFWKYSFLKDICNQEPTYYPASYSTFNGNEQYLCQPFYRLNTKILDDLYDIRSMARLEIISQLNELGLCLHILDDGSRNDLWNICLAEYTDEEKELYISICKDRFGLNCYLCKDDRYAYFDANSSRRIDEIILKTLPNDLDIVHKKIIDNDKITKPANYIYIISNNGNKQGLNTYCRSHGFAYKKAKSKLDELNVKEIEENNFIQLMEAA